jgi:hypothetical protein
VYTTLPSSVSINLSPDPIQKRSEGPQERPVPGPVGSNEVDSNEIERIDFANMTLGMVDSTLNMLYFSGRITFDEMHAISQVIPRPIGVVAGSDEWNSMPASINRDDIDAWIDAATKRGSHGEAASYRQARALIDLLDGQPLRVSIVT